MHGSGIDRLARELAAGRSRRAVVRALAGGAAGGLLAALDGHGAGAAAKKVPICHLTGSATTAYTYVLVSDVPNGPHSRHAGDVINVDLQTDPDHCGACGNACGAWEGCVAGSCRGCGEVGEPCCVGATSTFCNGGLTCDGGTCQEACLAPRAVCSNAGQCCQDEPTACEEVPKPLCGGSGVPTCCHPGGSCADDCACCGALLCNEFRRCDNDPGND